MTTTNHRTTARNARALAELQRIRRDALVRDLRTATRILNPDVTGLSLAPYGPAPAWTDGREITLNVADLPADLSDRRAVAVWAGAAYHELGHTLLTPRPGSALLTGLAAVSDVTPGNLWAAFNVAEDQRQERLMVARFAPLRGYLLTVVADLILSPDSPCDPAFAWALLCGRLYVPADARATARAAFVAAKGDALASEVARLIGAYQRLTDPGEADSDQALALIVDLAAALAEATPDGGGGVTRCDPSRRTGRPVEAGDPGTPDASDSDEEAREASDSDEGDEGDDEGAGCATGGASDDEGDEEAPGGPRSDDSDSEGDEGDEGADGPEGDADGPQGDTDSEGDSDSDSEGDSDRPGDAEGDEGDEGDEGAQVDRGDSEATGHGDGSLSDHDDQGDDRAADLSEALSEALSEVLRAPDVTRDLNRILDAVEAAQGTYEGLRPEVFNYGAPSTAALDLRDRLGDELSALRAESASGWERGTDSGRINVGRLFAPHFDPLAAFDRFTPDTEAETSAEVVVLVDLSGSMDSHMGDLSEQVWAMRHAAARAEVNLTVLGFASDPVPILLSEAGEVPGDRVPVLRVRGTTEPAPALRRAYSILRDSDAAHKAVIILSDGDWDTSQGEGVIEALRDLGVWTAALLYVSPFLLAHRGGLDAMRAMGDQYAHGAEYFAILTGLDALTALFAEVVRGAMTAQR